MTLILLASIVALSTLVVGMVVTRGRAARRIRAERTRRHGERDRDWWVLHSFMPSRRKRLTYIPRAGQDDC